LKNLAEPAPIALPALGKPGSEHSSLFCCYRDRLSAIKIGFLAETLRRQRFGRQKTAKAFAEFGCSFPQPSRSGNSSTPFG
jgi:hypothetical protein